MLFKQLGEKAQKFFRRFSLVTNSPQKDLANTAVQQVSNYFFADQREELSPLIARIYDLHSAQVGDLMIPRGQIEMIDLEAAWSEVEDHLAKLSVAIIAVCNSSIDEILGVLYTYKLIGKAIPGDLTKEELLLLLEKPYFIPSGNNALGQINEFIDNHHGFAFVVDEYGEILGGINKDILIEHLFKSNENKSLWQKDGSAIITATSLLRDINHDYNLNFPLDGPKTLNGLLLEYLEDIPDADLSVKINDLIIEVIHCEDRQIKTVRIIPTDSLATNSQQI